MRRSRLVLLALGTCLLAPTQASAQQVALAGQFGERADDITPLPLNPPIEPCAPDESGWAMQNQARCPRWESHILGNTGTPPTFHAPTRGVQGARVGTAATSTLPPVATPGTRPPGLNVGDPFRLPAEMMRQSAGIQTVIPRNNPVRQIDTDFTVIAPAAARSKNPPANTRVFAANGWVGQSNGNPASPVTRTAAAQTIVRVIGSETMTFRYLPGPNAFGGTMVTLLEGSGRRYVKAPTFQFPTVLQPVIGSFPIERAADGLSERNGAGWDYTIPGGKPAGFAKGFGVYPNSIVDAIVGPDCLLTPPPRPTGCNEVNFWQTPFPGVPPTTMSPAAVSVFNSAPGVHLGAIIPGSTSTRHVFAWTTGEIRIRRIAIRTGITLSETVTARGYDTTATTPGGTRVRNVGLVAGSYTIRNPVQGTRLEPQLVGLDLRLTPEPGATGALFAGLGGLTFLGGRARRGRGAAKSRPGAPGAGRARERILFLLALLPLVTPATPATAQFVGMAGEYSESVSPILHFPMNPPIEDCAPSDAAWATQQQARCVRRAQHLSMTTAAPLAFRAPHHGVYGAQLGTAQTSTLPSVATPGPRPPGLNVGDPFRVPAGMMGQALGRQADIVFDSPIRQIDTSLTARGPATAREKNPPANTRVFARDGWIGQNDGAATPAIRTAATQTLTRVIGDETLTLTYTPGPNAFGGTMATLLDGLARAYRTDFPLEIPPSILPAIVTQRFDDGLSGLKERGGPGWDYTVQDARASGYLKMLGVYPAFIVEDIVAPTCTATAPPTPTGCNEVNFWETPYPGLVITSSGTTPTTLFNGAPGVRGGFQNSHAATSTRHAFAWTTGEVRIRRVAIRSGATQTDTVTARGYDTTTTGPSGTQRRRIGLVAGAYTVRNPVLPQASRLDSSIVGLDLKLTPEPGSSVMLACALGGLGGLAGLAARRRATRATSAGIRRATS